MVPVPINIFWITGYILKILIKPKLTIANMAVKPKITPSIKGIDFLTPWLKPEWEATTLLGPGEQLVTNIYKERDRISGCIIKR